MGREELEVEEEGTAQQQQGDIFLPFFTPKTET